MASAARVPVVGLEPSCLLTLRDEALARMRRDSAGNPFSAVFESTFQIDRTQFGLNGAPKFGGLKVSISKKVDVHIAMATTLNGPPR